MKRFKQYIFEGGHAVSSTVPINQDNVKETLKDIYKKLLPALNIPKEAVAVLGSTGKKRSGETSGDIDLAIDVSALFTLPQINTEDDMIKYVESVVEDIDIITDYSTSKGFRIISVAWPIKNVDELQRAEYVQLDLMLVQDLEYSKFVYWSPESWRSNYKGTYRNFLLIAIANVMDVRVVEKRLDKEGIEVSVIWKKNFFDLSKGLMRGMQSKIGKKGQVLKNHKTIESKIITKVPDEIITMLLGPKFNVGHAYSFETLYEIINNSKDFIHKDKKKEIFKRVVELCKEAGMMVPKELKQYI